MKDDRRKYGEARLGIIRKPEAETAIQRLSRRIHNQRARLRQMDGFHWGNCHLRTIKRYVWARQKLNEAAARIEALTAEVERLEKVLDGVFHAACDAPELNMSNYDEDDVSALNAAMIEIHRMTYDARAALQPQEKVG